MALTVNTNVSSIIAQRSMNRATNTLNSSMERMTTGYKINSASDNAAGYSIAKQWVTQLGSLDAVAANTATGSDLLTTAEETYGLLADHLQRIRDLTEQASNGTYGSSSLRAIQAEVAARLQEISRISANAEFNGIKLMSYDMTEGAKNKDVGLTDKGLNIQVGLYANQDSRINLSIDLFKNASVSGLFSSMASYKTESGKTTFSDIIESAGASTTTLDTETGFQAFAAACAGMIYTEDKNLVLQTDEDKTAREMIVFLDDAIDEISNRVTKIGAAQNRLESALSALDVQSENITSSLSTLRDTDVAYESSAYLRAQILQQASSTLLSTANQLPSVALNLL